uniref:Uncharacterized protein n=1 Tax=Quercus lobata TaxID=97700 RepID=A0A7N2R2R6_QUELO
MDTSTCIHNSSNYISPSMRYRYVKVGTTSATEVADSCRVEKITRTSWPRMNWYMVLRFHGFKVIVKAFAEESYATSMTRTMFNAGSVVALYYVLVGIWGYPYYLIMIHLAVKFLFGTPFVVAFLIYKWRRRNFSMYDTIEDFLQSHNNLVPIRYSYSKIKKMTNGVREKLGGGFATVFKGKL